MIPAIIGAVAAVAGAVMNANAKRKERKRLAEQEHRAQQQEAEQKRFYEKEYNTPYLESEEASNATAELKRGLQERGKIADQAATIAGASPEAQMSKRESSNRIMADFYNRLAQQGTSFKRGVRNQYLTGQAGSNAALGNIGAMKGALDREQAESWNNLMQNAGNFASQYGGSLGKGSTTGGAKTTSGVNEEEAGGAFKRFK